MTEQGDAVADLDEAGVLQGIHWAGASAYRRAMADYDPDTGHGAGWVGYTAHVLLCDRLDRVFSCGDYQLASGDDSDSGTDVLTAGLTDEDLTGMPRIEADVVQYSPLNNSPGWCFGRWRWLLSSFSFGESRRIPWARKSPTKRRVAAWPDPDQFALFAGDTLMPEELARIGIEADEEDPDTVTLVLAHSIHKELRQREFFLGRPRLDPQQAWHWRHDLLANPPALGGGLILKGGQPSPSLNPNDVVSDAPVRLRKQPREQNSNETSG